MRAFGGAGASDASSWFALLGGVGEDHDGCPGFLGNMIDDPHGERRVLPCVEVSTVDKPHMVEHDQTHVADSARAMDDLLGECRLGEPHLALGGKTDITPYQRVAKDVCLKSLNLCAVELLIARHRT